MPDNPSARTRLNDQPTATAAGVNFLVVIAAVALNPDIIPRVYSSPDALLTQHKYCDGADYVACHLEETQKPVIFVGLPIVTAGEIGRVNSSGNSGSSVVSLVEGADGPLGETDGVLTVIDGGTVGTDQIKLGLSLDGGRTTKPIRIGTATSYTIEHIEVTVNLTVGTLVAGDTILTWHTTAPRWDQAGLEAAREALAAQQKLAYRWLIVGDLTEEDDATDVVTEVNAYETENKRFVRARVQVRDRLPQAEMSRVQVRMTGNPNLTFAEVGGTGDTITRSAGSWIADGFAVGDTITVTGSVSNNVTGPIASLSATVITLGTTDLAAEGPVGNVTVVATPTLTFAEVGGTGDTITRNRGSWLADGFREGDKVAITGTASNNITATVGLATVTATVLTFDTTDLAAEVVGSYGVSITAGETKAQHVAAMDAEFADIDDEKRVDLTIGRGRKQSRILGYKFRRPAAWAPSIREFQHDVHIATWAKEFGPVQGFDLEDEDGNLVEYDEEIDGGALAARFTCLKRWPNGPGGTFVARAVTRAVEGSLLGDTHNLDVANVACSVVQRETENAVGRSLVLNSDGTATAGSLKTLEEQVNSALIIALLKDNGEGPRASSAVWRAQKTDVLNVPDATLHGRLSLLLNGTLVHIDTVVEIQTAG